MPNPVFIRPEILFRVALVATFGEYAVVGLSLVNLLANSNISQRTIMNFCFQYGTYFGVSLTSDVGPSLVPIIANSELLQKYVKCVDPIYTESEKAMAAVLLFTAAGFICRTGNPDLNVGVAGLLTVYVDYIHKIVENSPGPGSTPFLYLKPIRGNVSIKQQIMFINLTLTVLVVSGVYVVVLANYAAKGIFKNLKNFYLEIASKM